jgi:hypothetical protein
MARGAAPWDFVPKSRGFGTKSGKVKEECEADQNKGGSRLNWQQLGVWLCCTYYYSVFFFFCVMHNFFCGKGLTKEEACSIIFTRGK